MKLALIRRQFSATGGAELYTQRLLAALAEAGHELHLFAEAWQGPPTGVALHLLPVTGSRSTRARAFAEAVDAAVAKERFDCVFSLERTLRQDVYRAGDGLHRVWLERRRQFAPWWRKPFVGIGAFHRTMRDLEAQTFDPRNTGRVIVNSDMVQQEILAHFRYPAERIHLVRNGVEVARFQGGHRVATRARFGLADDERVLLFVGSGWERKGFRYLLQAMRRLALDPAGTKLKLLVVGKGKVRSDKPSNVIYAGAMADVENAYAAADLLVFAPIYEPSSNVVIEALAAGLPVISSVQNGASELIDAGVNGDVLVDPADVDALVRAILKWSAASRPVAKSATPELDLKRNVAETVAILELAAREKAR